MDLLHYSLGAQRQKHDYNLAKGLRIKYGKGMRHKKSHVCRLAAGAFKRDTIPKSAETVKKSTLFSKPKLSLGSKLTLC